MINCTIYDNEVRSSKVRIIEDGKHFYISHDVTAHLLKFDNIYYLTPLLNHRTFRTDCLPFAGVKQPNRIPIYLVQGNFSNTHRNYNLLVKLLQIPTPLEYKIKLIGTWSISISIRTLSK